jgi:HEAT repeat protein
MQLQRFLVPLRRAMLSAALACNVAALGFAEGRSDAASTPQPLMWTGRWVDRDLPEGDPRKAANDAFAAEQKQRWQAAQTLMQKEGPEALSAFLREELTQFRIDRKVTGLDLSESALQLFGLIARASWEREFPGRWDLLVDLRIELGNLLVEAGHPEAFLEMYSQSVLFPAGCVAPPFELVPASAALLAQDAAALAAPKLAAFRSELQSASPQRAEPASAPSQGIEEAVREGLRANNPDMIRELGVRAVPVLEQIVRDQPEELPLQASSDPLALLLDLREQRGAQLILDLLDGGAGFLFKKRVIRSMMYANVLSDNGTWAFATTADFMRGTPQPPTLVEAVWLDVLARLVSDSEVGRDSIVLVYDVAKFDALDERVQRALNQLLDSDDPDAAPSVVALLKDSQGRQSTVPILEHALGHRQDSVRAAAAGLLVFYSRNAALRARVDDPNQSVRLSAGRSMLGAVGRPFYRESDRSVNWYEGILPVVHDVDARDTATVARLLKDGDASVREVGLQVLFEHPDLSIPAESLVGLAKDASASLRGQLASWPPGKPGDPQLLQLLAQDADRNVLKKIDDRLQQLATTTTDFRDAGASHGLPTPNVDLMWQKSYLPALLNRVTNQSCDFLNLRAPLALVGNDPTGAPVLLKTVHEKGTEAAKRTMLLVMDDATDGGGYPFAWASISLPEVAAWTKSIWALVVQDPSLQRNLWRALQLAPIETRLALRSILSDATAPPDLRLLCGVLTAERADPGWRKDLRDLIVDQLPKTPENPLLGRENVANEIGKSVQPYAQGVELVAELLRSQEPSKVSVALATTLFGREGMPAALAVEILEKHADDPMPWSPVLHSALKAIDLSETEPRTELMQRVLGNQQILRAGLATLGRAQLPQHLTLLEDALLGRMVDGDSDWERQVQKAAAQALSCYLSDGAAEILLKGLGSTTDEDVRKSCFDALDTIRRYQDEKERWAQRKGSKQAQDAAIAELMPMLADKDANVRAQAARSMGALGAVEQLPALVRMLKDSDQTVRKAAQDAIDALTAIKQAPADGKKD